MNMKSARRKTSRRGRQFAWLPILVLLAVLSSQMPRAVSAFTPPEECTGTQEEWEDQIRQREDQIKRLRDNLRASRNAHFDLIRPSAGLPSGKYPGTGDPIMDTLANPDFNSWTPQQRMAAMDAATLADLQRQADPLNTPRPGANSLAADQRFARDIPQLRSQIAAIQQYIDKCFKGAYYQTAVPGHSVTAWNCSSLSGQWTFEIHSSVTGDELSGYGTFTLPPRPESGPWRTPAFSFTMDGTRVEGDTYWEITVQKSDVVLEFATYPDGLTSVSLVSETTEAQIVIHYPDPPYIEEYCLPGYAALGFLGGSVIEGKSPMCN